jgi:hypothetical protein
MKSAPAIAFDYHPCRVMQAALVVMSVLAVSATWPTGLETVWKAVLSLVALSLGVFALARHRQCDIRRVARGESGWLLVDDNGSEWPAELASHVRRGNLIILEFGQGTRRIRLPLTPWNSEPDLRRRLALVLAAGTPAPPSLVVP